MNGKNNYIKVLTLLRESYGECVSGERISERPGLSRAAIWKHIEKLRDEGYIIEATPRSGYRLVSAPDILCPAEIKHNLQTNIFGRNIICHQVVDSTNKAAGKLAGEGAPEGTVVVAGEQTAGKGRRGREWFSPPGTGLWMSLILRPQNKTPARLIPVTAVAALAAARAIRRSTTLPVMLKWPNDLFLKHRKVGGILAELKSEPELVHYIILGIGLNINQAQKDFPGNIKATATSLQAESGRGYERKMLCRAILEDFEHCYDEFLREGFINFRDEWLSLSITHGQVVTIARGEEKFIGKAVDMDMNGALVIADDAGKRHSFSYGETE